MLAKSGFNLMKLPGLNTVPKVADAQLKRDSLDAVTILVFQNTDGTNTITDISDITGLEPNLAQKIVANLIARKILYIEGFTLDSESLKQPLAADATPRSTPRTEITVTTERNVRFGFRYFSARNREKGKGIGLDKGLVCCMAHSGFRFQVSGFRPLASVAETG